MTFVKLLPAHLKWNTSILNYYYIIVLVITVYFCTARLLIVTAVQWTVFQRSVLMNGDCILKRYLHKLLTFLNEYISVKDGEFEEPPSPTGSSRYCDMRMHKRIR